MKNEIKLNIKGVDFDVVYDYRPEEPPSRCLADNTGYPGAIEVLDILQISHKETDFTQFYEGDMDKIKDIFWKTVSK
jgi:hypothetical protein